MVGKKRWRTKKHAHDFRSSFERHVFPEIGDRPIDQVGDAEAQAVLDPLYAASPDNGRRVRERCEAVWARARARKQVHGDNPFAWETLKHVYPPKPAEEHLKAIPYKDLPALFTRLVDLGDDPVALAAR